MAQAKLKLTPVVVDELNGLNVDFVGDIVVDQISKEGKRKKEQLGHIRNTMN